MLKQHDKTAYSPVQNRIGIENTIKPNLWKKVSLILGSLLILTIVALFYFIETEKKPDDHLIGHDMACFVQNIRAVSSDPIVIRSNLENAYSFITPKAKRQLDKIVKEIKFPDRISSEITVAVDIKSITLKNKSLCVVVWSETMYEKTKQVSSDNFKSTFRLKFAQPLPDGKVYHVNPSGIYINNIVIEPVAITKTGILSK